MSTIDQLIELAGPSGPMGSELTRQKQREALSAGDPLAASERILGAVAAVPPLPANVPRKDFEFAASELLGELSEAEAVRELLERVLHNPPLRGVALDALSLLANPAAGPALAVLAASEVKAPFLSEDELIRLASALGCVGGDSSSEALEQLRARPCSPLVARELDIARQALHGPRT